MMSMLMITLVAYLLGAAMAARILGVFPVPSISHQLVFRALTLELAQRGHQLVVINTDPAHLHPNITEIDIHDVAYPMWEQKLLKRIFEDERKDRRSNLNQYKMIMNLQVEMLDAIISLPKVQTLISSFDKDYFDLIILESHVRLPFAFKHKFKAPLLGVSSFGATSYTFESMGIPSHPVFYPDALNVKIANFGFLDKINAIVSYLSRYYVDVHNLKRLTALTHKYFGQDTPSLPELESQTDMLFLNVNPIWDGIKATPSNVLYMWRTHFSPAKELPKDLKSFLDLSSRGVVYMSLGTNIKSSELSNEHVSLFVEAFRLLPYDVVWKWELDELPGKPENVHIAKWLPQPDLLKHPNVKVFITQGGQQSVDEALQARVPLIGLPTFADQEANVERIEIHGVGVALNIKTLTVDQLVEVVNRVSQSEKYRAAVRRISRLLEDGDGSVARAAGAAEYVLRHGGARHLRSPAAGVSVADYFMLDVVLTVAATAAFAAAVLLVALYYCCYKCIVMYKQIIFKKTQYRYED